MGKKLLISDANIIIDIVAGELVEAMFSLEYEFATPDILYAEELEEQHPEIVKAGLQVHELAAESVIRADTYFHENSASRVSVNDCLALSLAKQEQCTLLTGDSKLKQLAIVEGVTVRGTLWLVEAMFNDGIVTVREVEVSYQKMLDDGSRLPIKKIQKQLKSFNK